MNIGNFFKNIYSYLFSTKAIDFVILIVTIGLLTAILSSRYYFFNNIVENNISKKDVYATRDLKIIDSEKTEKIKREVASKVSSIYIPVQDDYIKINFDNLFNVIEEQRDLDNSQEQKQAEIKRYLDIPLEHKEFDANITYLLEMPEDVFTDIKEQSTKVLTEILEEKVSESDLAEDLNKKIILKFNNKYSLQQTKAMLFLIRRVLVPNMVVDEEATELAKKNAMNSVKPITVSFLKGQKIISEGEVVTKIQREALKLSGQTLVELNISGIIGIFLIVAVGVLIFAYYMVTFQPLFLYPSYLILMSLLTVLMSVCAVVLPNVNSAYWLPLTVIPLILCIFTKSRVAMIMSILYLCVISVALQYNLSTTIIFLMGILSAVLAVGTIDYTKRMDLIKIGFIISNVQALVLIGIYLLGFNFHDINVQELAIHIIGAYANGLISALVVLSVLPMIESAFKIISPYGLAELGNHNQPLLKKLQFDAPGTYHHSLMVSNLSEAAAEAIGANAPLVKIGALYHDVGKLKRPLFFIENQSYFDVDNPHEKFPPRLSKMVITAHPKDGVELAKGYKLSPVIYPFIAQHHGDSIASYFYNQALKEEGAENVTEEQFRYNGQKPNTKEIAILMLADAVESAVRSLKSPSPEEIEAMIDKIIKDRLLDGQLSESPLTLKDLKTIAATFNRILRGMQHHRIRYQEDIIEDLEKKNNQDNNE